MAGDLAWRGAAAVGAMSGGLGRGSSSSSRTAQDSCTAVVCAQPVKSVRVTPPVAGPVTAGTPRHRAFPQGSFLTRAAMHKGSRENAMQGKDILRVSSKEDN